MIHLIWGLAVGAVGLSIAFDYRNIGLRAYDLLAARTPGGPPDPRFSPDVFRVIWGIVGIAGVCVVGFQMWQRLLG